MDLQSAKLDVMQKILGVSKASLLEKIDKLLEEEMVIGYTVDGSPLTREIYNKRLDLAEEQIQSEEYITQKDLEDESENW
jgi:DNA-binding Lrp family transcriptional regulator